MLLTSDKFLVQYDFTIHRSSNKHQTFFFIKKMISWKKASTESEGAKIIDNYDNNNNKKRLMDIDDRQQRTAIKYMYKNSDEELADRDHLVSFQSSSN